MLILKRSLLVLVTSIFTTLLFATAWTSGVVRTVGSPAPVKKTLSDSGIYDSAIASFLNQAKSSTSSSGEVSLTDPVIQKIANTTFTPEVLQKNTEAILDGTYRWLNGDVALPDFKLDLSSLKTSFATNAASAIEAQLATLPACPTNVRTDNFDPLSATCLPKNLTAASAANTVKTNLLSGKGFLDNPVITANDLKVNNSNQPVFTDQFKKVPGYFQKAKMAPLVLGGLAVLCGLAIIFLSASRIKGIRHISFTLVFVGILMIGFAYGASYLLNQKLLPKIKIDNNQVLEDKIQTLAKDLTQQIDKNYWIFGGAYTGLGVVGLVSPLVLSRFGGKKKTAVPASKTSAEQSKEEAPTTQPESDKTEAPTPPKKKISVQ